MYIHKLTMNNFRGAKDLTLELDPRLNVFVGTNGAGKSSVLDATAILLSWLANRIKNPRASGRPIKIPDINNAETVAGLMAEIHNPIDLTKDINIGLTEVKCDLSRTRRSQKRIVRLYGMVQLSVLAEYVRELIHAQGEEASIPLIETFPNCQFLITTHSPHVVTLMQPENLHLLEMGEDGLVALQASESYGKTVERVLEDLMGLETTRPDEVDEDLRAISRIIGNGNLDEAEISIEKLEDKIGADPDLVRARAMIHHKRVRDK